MHLSSSGQRVGAEVDADHLGASAGQPGAGDPAAAGEVEDPCAGHRLDRPQHGLGVGVGAGLVLGQALGEIGDVVAPEITLAVTALVKGHGAQLKRDAVPRILVGGSTPRTLASNDGATSRMSTRLREGSAVMPAP